MADPSWSKHVADILRRNDIRTYATVPDYIGDNEVHQTTGGQPTATAARADLAAIARGAGVDETVVVRTEDELERAWDRVLAENGPHVAIVKVAKGPSEHRLDRDVIGSTRRFMHALAGG